MTWDDEIDFDWKRQWQGILFHLKQPDQGHWDICDRITTDSLLHLYSRLKHERRHLTFSKAGWKRLTDEQRLGWLVVSTETMPDMIAERTMDLIKGKYE